MIYCECGGETQLESFDHPKRDIEWFYRCRKCEKMTGSYSSWQEAEEASKNAVSSVTESPTVATTTENAVSQDGYVIGALD